MNNRARRPICVSSICLGIFILITIGIEGFDRPLYIQILNVIMIAFSLFYIVAGWALLRVRVTPYKDVQISKSVSTEKIIKRKQSKNGKKNTDPDDDFDDTEKRYRRWRVVMACSLKICIFSIIAVCLTHYTSSLALTMFFVSCLTFWVAFCQLLDISASSPWW